MGKSVEKSGRPGWRPRPAPRGITRPPARCSSVRAPSAPCGASGPGALRLGSAPSGQPRRPPARLGAPSPPLRAAPAVLAGLRPASAASSLPSRPPASLSALRPRKGPQYSPHPRPPGRGARALGRPVASISQKVYTNFTPKEKAGAAAGARSVPLDTHRNNTSRRYRGRAKTY